MENRQIERIFTANLGGWFPQACYSDFWREKKSGNVKSNDWNRMLLYERTSLLGSQKNILVVVAVMMIPTYLSTKAMYKVTSHNRLHFDI